MHDRGMWLWSWENPRLVPVRLFNPNGPRIPAWLNDDGTYDFEAPAGGPAYELGTHWRPWSPGLRAAAATLRGIA